MEYLVAVLAALVVVLGLMLAIDGFVNDEVTSAALGPFLIIFAILVAFVLNDLGEAQEKIEKMERYSKYQQVINSSERLLKENRDLLDKYSKDTTVLSKSDTTSLLLIETKKPK